MLKMKMRKTNSEVEIASPKILIDLKQSALSTNPPTPQEPQEKQVGTKEAPVLSINSDSDDDVAASTRNINNRGLMNLLTLKNRDLQTIEGWVNDACINALSDVLHKKTDRTVISICHTQLFSTLTARGWQEANKFLQWDPSSLPSERWQHYEHAQACITSNILLIPCHFPGHWVLAIRIILPSGTHSLYILDSLGRDSSRATFSRVREHLQNTPILKNKVKFKALNIREQTNDECGSRMAKYMANICDQWENENTTGFPAWLERLLTKERNDKRDLSIASRQLLRGRLDSEIKKICT